MAFGLAVVGGSYAATGSEGVQVLALLGLAFGVLPAITRAFGESNDLVDVARERDVPLGVMAISFAFLVSWGALVFIAAPDLGLGPWFWSSVVIWPWLELYIDLAERRLRRDGSASWTQARPVRDLVLAGLATMPVIAIIAILEGLDVGEALLTGALCGGIVFLIGAAFAWASRRARAAERPG